MSLLAGGIVTASDLAALADQFAPGFVRKTADETVTSSATLQNDDELFIAVEANSVYEFTMILFYTGNTTGDIKFVPIGPSGSTIHFGGVGADDTDTTYGTRGKAEFFARLSATSTQFIQYSGSTSVLTVILKGLIIVSSTAGNLQLQWAQNTSDGTGTVVKAGSYIRCDKVG